MTRGSRSYGSLVIGSYVSQASDSVVFAANGSMNAVAGSGNTSMSEELIALQPRIDEPSKPTPSVKTESVSSETGIAKCRSEEHTSELQSPCNLVCRLLL